MFPYPDARLVPVGDHPNAGLAERAFAESSGAVQFDNIRIQDEDVAPGSDEVNAQPDEAASAPLNEAGPAPAASDAVIAAEPGNLAAGKNMTASSYTQTYVASNASDSNQATYWESNNNAFPQWLQVDLAAPPM
ncbi:discoidin domain-containing protein [Paenibacillus sp. JCM 10914]|uniref:discoidin domain-containing protein n=1 Tax=Paenibacillus sp. JCM 10914 TaxID=1236974 RepID=UPI0003CC300F|nr:secreted glycosyl hydrolase [Paenibacillus sp. JCM 10914]